MVLILLLDLTILTFISMRLKDLLWQANVQSTMPPSPALIGAWIAQKLDQFAMHMSFYSLIFQAANRILMVHRILLELIGLLNTANSVGVLMESSLKALMVLMLMALILMQINP